MEPENIKFGGGVAASVFSPAVLVAVLIAGILICILPRHKAILPFLAAAILIPTDQVLLLGGLHFPMGRILALFGLIRICLAKFSGKERIFSGGINTIDVAMIILTLFSAINGMLLWQVWGEVVYQFGQLYSAFGFYFLVRYLIQDEDDVKRAIRVLAYVTIIITAFMVFEWITGRNLIYTMMGGAHSFMQIAGERDNKVRAAGPFAHAILAGTFGGFVTPLFLGLWAKKEKMRIILFLGAIGGAIMSFTANSSTALFALIGAIIGLSFWPLRRNMRLVRWGIVGTLIALQLYMKSPVWHIISDVDLSGGSSSYHRYMLVDQCIRHFWDWVLIGTRDYASWGWDMWDLSNQYVGIADTAGLIPFIAFLATIVCAFKYLGRARQRFESDKKQEIFVWAIGASLFANVVAFFGIGYFDQTIIAWYALLAMISAVTLPARQVQPEPAASPVAGPPALGGNSALTPAPANTFPKVRFALRPNHRTKSAHYSNKNLWRENA